MRRLASLLFLVINLVGLSACAEDFDKQRAVMVSEIKKEVRATRDYIGKSSLDEQVMAAMANVPRHEFVPETLQRFAYLNRPLPIGEDQTISQPYIVALMTDLAEVDKDSIVLEVGTGSGYQAAVLGEIVKHVYTIEIIEKLGRRAEQTLIRLGYNNITVRIGDGYHGWPEHAPFDAIVVTAAPEQVPQPLIEQLQPGGRLVIPVGRKYGYQSLQVIEKQPDGSIEKRDVLPVGFVPLTGEH